MRRPVAFLILILISYLGLVIYSNRALLFSRFDQVYWKDKYEQSQWKLPLSQRTIGDDGLYLYEGYRLIHGGDPTSSNAEMPPLGKYLIGASILAFGSGYIYGLMTTLMLIAGTYILAKLLVKQTLPALLITVLLATDPLITNQYALTMMDALQASLLIMFLIILFHILTPKQKYSKHLALLAGVILGLFSETKLPVLTPIIALTGIWYVWTKTKALPLIAIFLIGGLAGYLAPYCVYFAHGHTIIDWLKIQKWIISFYTHSNLTPTWGSVVTTLLFGTYQNIFSRMWEKANEWSPSWGLLFFASLSALGIWLRTPKKDTRWGILFTLLLATFAALGGIPFWTRYLVVLLPLLYIAGSVVLSRLPLRLSLVLWASLLIINVASSVPILFSSPAATANQVIYNIEHLQFADLYEDTTASFRKHIDRETFRHFGLATMAGGEIEFIDITPTGPMLTGRSSPQLLSVTVTYYTRRLGPFTRQRTIPFVLEDNRWRIPWEWSFLLPELTETHTLETQVIPARRGSIFASDKKPLAEDIEGFMVWVTPGKIDKTKEDSLLSLLETTLDGRQPKVAIHQRIVGNTLSDAPIPIGVIPHPKTDPNIIGLSAYAGVTFTDAFARITHPNNLIKIGDVQNTVYSECCSVLYTTTNYDGVTGLEKAKNEILKGINGGTLILKDSQGHTIQTFLEKTKHDGQNVQL